MGAIDNYSNLLEVGGRERYLMYRKLNILERYSGTHCTGNCKTEIRERSKVMALVNLGPLFDERTFELWWFENNFCLSNAFRISEDWDTLGCVFSLIWHVYIWHQRFYWDGKKYILFIYFIWLFLNFIFIFFILFYYMNKTVYIPWYIFICKTIKGLNLKC